MKKNKDIGKHKWPDWLPAVCMSLLLLVCVWTVLGNYWETNDDRFIAEILSGSLGGQPEGHVIYVNYILSWPLSLLYRLTDKIPWYGATILLFHVLIYTALFQSAYSRGEKLAEKVIIAGFMGSCVLLNLYITATLQYTSTAVLMSVTGYMCLLLDRRKRRGWALFCFFEGMAFLLRDQAMLMIQPIGMLVCISEFWREEREAGGRKKKEWVRKWIRKTCCIVLITGGVVLIGLVGTLAGYHGEKWADFKRYNRARTVMFDYYGTPEYEDVEAILRKYDVSFKEYEALRRYMILGGQISTECMEELAGYVKRTQEKKPSIPEVAVKMLEMRSNKNYLEVGMVSAVVCCVGLLYFLLQGHITALVSFMGLVIGSMSVEGYLIYRGRLPLRVMLPLYACEIFLVIAIMLRDYTDGERNMRHCVSICLAAVLFATTFTLSGWQQYYAAKRNSRMQSIYIEGLVEVQKYCRSHPQKRYILDMNSFMYYRGCVLETRLAGQQNSVYSGGWFSKSPVVDHCLRQYLEGREDNICLIVFEDGLGEANYAVTYLAEVMEGNPVIMDRFEVSNGAVYLVWGFTGDQE